MRIGQLGLPHCLIACVIVAALMLGLGAPLVYAGGMVGYGTPASCTEAAFNTALAGGGTVTFNCGLVPYTLPLTNQKSINISTTIDGGGKITLSGQNAHRLFEVNQGLTLRNIVLTRGYVADDGGAIINYGVLTLENSTIRDSRATASGGAIVSYGRLTISNSLLEGNLAANGGALYPRWAGSRTNIDNSVLRNNRTLDPTNGWGGAILAWDGAPVTIANSDIYSNTARIGGGIYNFGASPLTLQSNTRLRDNYADAAGGGLYSEGTATLTNVTLSGNLSTNDAGGLWNAGTATLINVTLTGNSAVDAGGGLMNVNTAALTNVTVTGNSAGGGGGLFNVGTITLTNVTLADNWATGSGGGGLTNYNTATLTNVTFSRNWVIQYGGGLNNFNGIATLTNVTFSVNSAANVGGGIYRSGGSVLVKNTIMAHNLPGGGCAGGVTNNGTGFNLASDMSCGFTYVQDVMLGPLANNGGSTQTHMPLPGSLAINFVTVGCPPPATDQRGAPRNVGACDAGAVEYGAMLPSLYLPIVRK